jgi:hypothetical protein
MTKATLAGVFASMFLAACGGGGGSGDTQPAAKSLTISMYGNPLVSASAASVVHAQVMAAASSASAGTSDANATVQSLQDALAARGVTAAVSAQVMDGTTLHQIVMGENNGLPPTPDHFKLDPSEWMIVNFQLDDMATSWDDPVQQAAVDQFAKDLVVFAQRAAVAGKAVFAIESIQTCDTRNSASNALHYGGLIKAFNDGAPIRIIGQIPFSVGFDTNDKPLPSPDLVHLGADCRTPDAYLQNLQVQSVADTIASAYKEAATASPASGASASGT